MTLFGTHSDPFCLVCLFVEECDGYYSAFGLNLISLECCPIIGCTGRINSKRWIRWFTEYMTIRPAGLDHNAFPSSIHCGMWSILFIFRSRSNFHWFLFDYRVCVWERTGNTSCGPSQIRQSAWHFSEPTRIPFVSSVCLFVEECDGYCSAFGLNLISLDSRPIAGCKGRTKPEINHRPHPD
jgi:hypothetical protein